MEKEIRICKLCGESFEAPGFCCQSCYTYLRNHPEGIYPLPKKGEIGYAENGDPICHICGMAYRKLGNHIYNKHHISQNDYREMFGLHHNTKLSHTDYTKQMKEYNTKYYDKVVKENLIKGGITTRISDNNILNGRKIGNIVIPKFKYTDKGIEYIESEVNNMTIDEMKKKIIDGTLEKGLFTSGNNKIVNVFGNGFEIRTSQDNGWQRINTYEYVDDLWVETESYEK